MSDVLELIRIWKEEKKTVTVELDLASLDHCLELVASAIKPRSWLFLNGDLGSGKTTFISLLLKKMGYAGLVSSPTFSIVNVMNLEDRLKPLRKVCHLDLYRLKKASELLYLGLEIEFTSDAFCIFEWAERIEPEGWLEFFDVTMCTRPFEILNINVEYQTVSSIRSYTLSWLEPQQFFVS